MDIWKRSLGNNHFLPFLPASLILTGILLFALFAAAADITIPYEVAIKGVENRELLKGMEDIADTIGLKDNPPASVALLRRRAERDKEQFMRMLRAMGYYSGRVEIEMDADLRPVQVVFQVEPGPAYLLKSFDLNLGERPELKTEDLPSPDRRGLGPGGPFRAERFLNAEKKVIENLEMRGFPFAKISERRVVVDHDDRTVTAALWVEPGPMAQFGRVEVTGLESTSETIVRRKIPWKEGDRYNAVLLELLHKDLVELGLFSTIAVTHGEALDGEGTLPVRVAVKERKYKSVGAGISYRSDEKLGVNFSWENRNFMGEGERLGLTATFSDLTYAAEANLRKPFFLRQDQALTLSSRLAEDKPDAYTSRNLANSALVVRDITNALKIGGGVGFKQAQITQLGERKDFSLVSLPLHLSWDRSDDLLDPTKGGRLGLQFAPFKDLFENLQFSKGKLSYGHYLRIFQSPSIVLAGRVTMGALSGAERLEIPADERFYGGGGGSVRGYAYQSLGPRAESIPTGGKSLIEVSLETRVRITERIGLAFFLDGGNAFEDIAPSSEEELFWGAGVGIRYFTPIGPFRFDVAMPIDRRDGFDDAFQIYISLGQSF
jgi:translocation and assembly module TamA